jgi:arylsulfatase A-like enzyme
MIRRFNAPITHTLTDGTAVPATQGKQLTYCEEPESMSRTKMVRSRDWKLVVRLAGGNELYNLPSDPFEMNNLYGHPEHATISAHLMEALVRWSLRTDTDRPFLTQVGA